MAVKPLSWLGSSLDDLRAFPKDARREAGYQLGRVQQGLMPSDWRPMGTVGPGAYEIRIHTGVEHRVFYVAKFEEAVYVLHAFQKKSKRGIATPKRDLELIRERLKWAERLHTGKTKEG